MALFRRKIYDELLRWKHQSAGTSAMLVEGARRVGKSTIVEEFAKNEYAAYLLIDFSKVTPQFRQTFLDLRNDLNSFFLYLSAFFPQTRFVERDTLVIFDEVQLFPPAREFIKHLVADGRYDYVETGSLVSLKANVCDILIPSEEESLAMYPMDFEEFLDAAGETGLKEMARSCCANLVPLPDELHRKAERLWREYMLVGGMPQAVAAYLPGKSLAAADRAKRSVLKLYREDIAKYAGGEATRVRAVFDAMPAMLSKHEKRLVYAHVKGGNKYLDFADAFAWMKEAMTANLCTRCTDPTVALALAADEASLKCYLCDTGLLVSQSLELGYAEAEDVYRQVLLGNVGVNEGMLVENAVAQQLAARGGRLFYYSDTSKVREDRMEIDFLTVMPFSDAAGKPRVAPIEVKSASRYKTVSLDKFKAKFGKRVGNEIVLHPRQLARKGNRWFLPLYMAGMW